MGIPLCPAGHLPHKGGDRMGVKASQNNDTWPLEYRQRGTKRLPPVISPPVGEMPGRAEGVPQAL
ncbi:lytic murein transglycosylase [Rhizobium leguminosarum bv. viciae]|nr:lytic murein transglycosylase [Rhizobium leguminosarum bv. viciae]